MNIDTRLQFGLLLVAAMSLGWSVGYYSRSDRIETLENEVNSYARAEKLNLGSLVTELENSSEAIKADISQIRSHYDWVNEKENMISRIQTLESDINKKSEQLRSATDSITSLNAMVDAKQKELDSYYPVNEEFLLDENTTKGVAGFDSVLGVRDVRSDRVEVTFGNETHVLYAGNYVEENLKGLHCKIILSGIMYSGSPERARFRTVCEKSNNPVNKDASR